MKTCPLCGQLLFSPLEEEVNKNLNDPKFSEKLMDELKKFYLNALKNEKGGDKNEFGSVCGKTKGRKNYLIILNTIW